VVTPTADYAYDAIYRLIAAEGREHIGQVTQPETTWNDAFRNRLAHPHDGQAMRRYAEQYSYDGAGNLLQLAHQAQGTSWRRDYAYAEASQLEDGRHSNRLSTTTVGGVVQAYGYDAHGNTISLPHLSAMTWSYLDQLESTSRQIVESGTPRRRITSTTRADSASARSSSVRMERASRSGSISMASRYPASSAPAARPSRSRGRRWRSASSSAPRWSRPGRRAATPVRPNSSVTSSPTTWARLAWSSTTPDR
jgi:hypothetical protein